MGKTTGMPGPRFDPRKSQRFAIKPMGITSAEGISPARRGRHGQWVAYLLGPIAFRVSQAAFAFAMREWAIITLGVLAFFWAITTSLLLFPYYSNNSDEPVYVLQAQMLLQGKLHLEADEFSEFFSPFFFINDGERVFSKYAPVQAGFLALGQVLFGSMRAALGLVAAGTVLFFYLFALQLFSDRRLAFKASVVLLLSPFFLIQSATFLPYVSGLMLCLAFGFLLLRGTKTSSTPCLVLSGVALGLAFFHRPFDALLFGIPFGLVFLALHRNNAGQLLNWGARVSLGFAPMLALTLAYNAAMTGEPLLFPFTFHETMDKLGFGPRRLHPTNTPLDYGWAEGLQALWTNSTHLVLWIFGGPILLAAMLVRLLARPFQWQDGLLVLILVAFPFGYLFFWGPYHLSEVWRGLSYLGPFYYLPMLVPFSLLGTRGIVDFYARQKRAAIVLILLMLAVSFWLVFHQVSQNLQYTEKSRAIYEPLREQPMDNALVFVPPLYGPFLLHPFAYLENNPSLDGPILYALDKGNRNFDLLDRYPDRQPYRFVYQGKYSEEPDDIFNTELIGLERVNTTELSQRLHITNPTDKPYVYVYVWNDGNTETYLLDRTSSLGDVYDVHWTGSPQGVGFAGSHLGTSQSSIDSISEAQPLAFAVAFTDSPSRDSQVIFERRFTFKSTSADSMEVIYPPQDWHNPDWPTGRWVQWDIRKVMRDSDVVGQDLISTPGDHHSVSVVLSVPSFDMIPVSIVEAPDGRLFYNELQTGNVRIIQDGILQEEPFATVDVATLGESGLLGLALAPNFSENRHVYVLRTVPHGVTGLPIRQEVIRFTDKDGKGVDHTVILENLPATQNSAHNAGRIEFGPDGKLWVTIGDGEPDPGAPMESQDPSSYYGKVLRFNRDGSIPSDNPYPDSAVYAVGFRNSFGMVFHPITGSLFVSENGPEDADEINIVVPGGNYGWPEVRGIANQPERFIDPIYVWDQPIAPTGMAFHPHDPHILFVCSAVGGHLRALTLGPQFESVVGEEIIAEGCHLDVTASRDGDLYISGFDSIQRIQLPPAP